MKHRFACDLEERKWQFKTLELKDLEAGLESAHVAGSAWCVSGAGARWLLIQPVPIQELS
ncbi:MAG: hypothetical protein C0443_02270 [Comamonadaceae bacterium]|nr:hypothetical protein [Comamonadaceae bacterium]